LAWGNLCAVIKTKPKKTKKMITIAHDAKEGKLKVYMMGVSQIFLAGILLTLVHIIFKKQINGLEQALS
jgi:hypothetical protein